jgi:MerR family transcriptional regulator, redox-sensitive transcriptional activator SoxR
LSIDKVAKLAEVTVSALRYYESRGLIAEGVRIGGRRHYTATVLHRLSAIRTLRLIGFSLADIEELLDEVHPPSGTWRVVIAARRAEVENQIHLLRALVVSLDTELDRMCRP